MISKKDIKRAQQWCKATSRKGLNLQAGNAVKLGKKQKHMTADERYDFIVKGKA